MKSSWWSTLLRDYATLLALAVVCAALSVITLAEQHPTIVAVTHASFRTLVSRELGRRGWAAEPGRRTLAPWSVHAFRRRMPGRPARGRPAAGGADGRNGA